MKDQTVIVTGAANGIGKSIAEAYCRKGCRVVLADVDEEQGERQADFLGNNGGAAVFVKADVRVYEDIQMLMHKAKEYFGSIDILVNNAGKMLWKSPYDITVDEWDDVLNTNLRSVFFASREAAKYMRENENGGSIVNIASTRHLMSEPDTELYAASKGGIVSLTHALAASFSEDGITVNAISPGWIETGDYNALSETDHSQHFSNRVGKPEDIARACLYLTDQGNDFINGTNLVIDGGMTKKMIYME